jgi:hypothetical protein
LNKTKTFLQVLNKLPRGDLKSIEKGQDLLNDSKKVQACSFVTVADDCFFSGMVKAAMKKHVG